MFSKTTIVSALMATVAMAAPAHHVRATGASFGLLSIRSGSDLQYLPINAADHALVAGGNTTSYCPLDAELCPSGKETALTIGSNGTLFMDTEVPGGQQVYIDGLGQFRYTVAHSAAIPIGSITSGFQYNGTAFGGALGSLTHSSGRGWIACPTDNDTFNVYLNSGGITLPNCEGIDIATEAYDGVAAWQYS